MQKPTTCLLDCLLNIIKIIESIFVDCICNKELKLLL